MSQIPQFRPRPGSLPPPVPTSPEEIKDRLAQPVPEQEIESFVDRVFADVGETRRVEPTRRPRTADPAGPVAPEDPSGAPPTLMGKLSIHSPPVSIEKWRVDPNQVTRDLRLTQR